MKDNIPKEHAGEGGHIMRGIVLEKVTINIGAGESGPQLEKSKKILEVITGKKVMITRTKKRTTFGAVKKKPIGAKVTIRGAEAKEILKKMLQALDNKVSESSFDKSGNFSFGIHEYINIPGIKYEPDVGILGMDVCVTLGRPGFRVKRRRIRPQKVSKHRISREEAMEFARKEFGVITGEEEET
jgi:large subunit ribosomal protein L5